MRLRPVLFVLGLAPAASFAAGWWAGLSAKVRPAMAVAAAAEPALPPTRPQPVSTTAAPPEDPTYKTKILPFLQKYCLECHNSNKAAGGLTLEGYQSEAHAR